MPLEALEAALPPPAVESLPEKAADASPTIPLSSETQGLSPAALEKEGSEVSLAGAGEDSPLQPLVVDDTAVDERCESNPPQNAEPMSSPSPEGKALAPPPRRGRRASAQFNNLAQFRAAVEGASRGSQLTQQAKVDKRRREVGVRTPQNVSPRANGSEVQNRLDDALYRLEMTDHKVSNQSVQLKQLKDAYQAMKGKRDALLLEIKEIERTKMQDLKSSVANKSISISNLKSELRAAILGKEKAEEDSMRTQEEFRAYQVPLPRCGRPTKNPAQERSEQEIHRIAGIRKALVEKAREIDELRGDLVDANAIITNANSSCRSLSELCTRIKYAD
jgi:hypothetical protein